ncbi:isoprenyl transferase [Boudabousia tangfeifanii]|uniref:Isoprenyl transferase n=1 Tax=Boudabousia tangfeifanii TaxID=1912795 RepID=A0A1D9MMT3_9ACTO|nr:isoprenyl transferase [Boudabousia tangfeifanii]
MPPSLRSHAQLVPEHVAIIMDGNGRWANQQGLPRTAGHTAGEASLMDTIAGAIEAGVKVLSVYAFSTENWRRSPTEVRFLMGYSREVLRRRCDELKAWNVRVRWSGRRPKLWKSVISELERAERLTANNTGLTLVMNLNYGGRAELADAAAKIAQEVADGKLNPQRITPQTIQKHLYLPDLPDVDLLIRTSGEQRFSNYLLWQCAYAEMVFWPNPWPEFGREPLWQVLLEYLQRDRRFGGAIDQVTKS